MFPAAHSFFGVVTHTYLASTSSGLNVVATSRPNIGLKVATLRPMFRFGKVTHTYLASKSPGLNVAWPQRRLASMSPGLNVAWPQCRGLNVAGLNVAWPQCPIVLINDDNDNDNDDEDDDDLNDDNDDDGREGSNGEQTSLHSRSSH